jgi:hypothetical protein
MLFTWSTQDLCIVFRGWHVHDTFSLIWTLLAIVALTAGYEGVRELSRRYETETAIRLEEMPRKSFFTHNPHNFLCQAKSQYRGVVERQIRGG